MLQPKKVLLVVGTRPEAIKMAPLYHAMRERPDHFDLRLCLTGQHRQMLDQVMATFELSADIDLNLMKPGQDLFSVTSSILLAMRDIFTQHRPDIALVHGDTTTCFAAATAAFYSNVPVGHVEAGLRTHNLRAPFPEEFNRQQTARIARWHFAPTKNAAKNLVSEGIAPSHIHVTGNTVVDSLNWILKRISTQPEFEKKIDTHLSEFLPFPFRSRRYVLITGHRRENFGQGFVEICEALKTAALAFPETEFVYPVHLNPQVQMPVNSILASLANVHLIQPVPYEVLVQLLRNCNLVLTDSGGIQEEAPSLGKPVLVMRDVTERPEAVEAGTVRLVGANRQAIFSGLQELLTNAETYRRMSAAHNPYGDGKACQRIVDALISDSE